MARAPRPGKAREQKDATKRFRITVKGETLEVPASLTLREKMAVRLATGIPFDQFFVSATRIGEDTVAVLWWLARRANGEPNLPWMTFEAEWEAVEVADVECDIVEDDGEATDDPES